MAYTIGVLEPRIKGSIFVDPPWALGMVYRVMRTTWLHIYTQATSTGRAKVHPTAVLEPKEF